MNRYTMRSQTVATQCVFALNGALFATWVSRLPALRSRLGASEPELGVALLGLAAGALVAMPASGWLCDRFGSRRVLLTALFGCAASFQLVPAAPSVLLLGLGLVVVGAFYGVWDVSMNTAATLVERAAERPLMPIFHGAFSVGGIAGAGIGAGAANAGLSTGVHFGIGAAAVGLAGAAVAPLMPNTRAGRARPAEPTTLPRSRATRRRLIVLGILTACITLGEGAAADWSAIFMHDERGASESLAALGYAAFCGAMAVGRFGGTWLLSRTNRQSAVRACGVVVFASVAVLILVDHAPTAIIAMAGWGLGVSLVFPAAMSAAAEHAARPAQGIATVSTIGYGGFLIGPPLIGFVAGNAGLAVALGLVAVLGLALAALAPAAAAPATSPDPDAARRERAQRGDTITATAPTSW